MHNQIGSQNRKNVPMPAILEKYREIIDTHLRADIPETGSEIYKMLRYCMGWSDEHGNPISMTVGKLLRPSLSLFTCESVSSSVYKALPAAVTLELIHNFSLIHDEIQDFDETRHHRPTLWKLRGVPRALVAGDVLKIVAESSLERMRFTMPPDTPIKCLALVTEACLEMIEGQYLDIHFEGRIDISLDQYLKMISLKTGALIRCSVEIGALVGNSANVEIARIFRRSGGYLGYLFQITDDILGVWGLEGETGKSVGVDVRRKKNSLPIVHAMTTSNESSQKAMGRVFDKDELSDADISEILEILESADSKTYCQKLAEVYAGKAICAIADANIGKEKLTEYQDLCEYLVVRKF